MITIKNTHTNKSITFDSTGTYILNEEDLGFIAGTHNTTKALGQHGEYITSTVLESRDISITGYILAGNIAEMEIRKADIIELINPLNDIEIIKGEYKIECKPISTVKFSTNYKENNEYECKLIISVFCANPFWKSLNEIKSDIALWKGMFHFPLMIPSTIIPHSGTDSTWKDLSGNLNNGLLSGFNFDTTSGWTSEGLKFDSDSYVTLPTLDLQEGTIQVNNQVATFDKDTDYRTTSANSNIVSLNTTVDGVMDVELGGNTLQNILPKVIFLDAIKTYSTTSTVNVGLISEAPEVFNVKPNTEYTLIFKANYTNLTLSYFYLAMNYTNTSNVNKGVHYQALTTVDSGKVFKIKYTTTSDIKKIVSVFLGGKEGSVDIQTGGYYMMLEGDWTNKEIPYFEGIRSVGESESNQIEVLSVGKNLFGGQLEGGGFDQTTAEKISITGVNRTINFIPVINGKNYILSKDGVVISGTIRVFFYDSSRKYLNNILTSDGRFISSTSGYITVQTASSILPIGSNIQIEYDTTPTTYEPYQEHRQPITLTNPLRGLPNGVRDIAKGNVLTRNVGKVVLNGSETLLISKIDEPVIKFILNIPLLATSEKVCVICDKFLSISHTLGISGSYTSEGCWSYSGSAGDRIYISILKSKLLSYGFIDNDSTTHIPAFKGWLQDNNTTIYYQAKSQTTENLAQSLKLKSFSSGTLQVNTLIAPYLSAYYPITLGGSLASNVSRIDLSNPLITTGLVKNYRVYNKILTTEEIARANTSDYLRGPALLVDLNSSYKELNKTGIIMGYKEPSLIVNIDNAGSVEIGMIIEFRAKGTLSNPSLFNVNTREQFKIEKNMVAGEKFVINTNFGKKKVEHYLNGVTANGFKYIKRGSTFLQLLKGSNLFRYDADTNLNNLEVAIYYIPCYLGVV